jgi:hypothetical protein
MRARLGQTQEPAEADPKRGRRIVLIAVAALLFGYVIGSQTGSGGPSINIDPDWDHRPAVAGAQEFFQAYRSDADDADDRFDERGLVVTGEFVRVARDDQGNPDLRLKTSDPEWPLGVDLLPDSYGRSAELKPGQIVTVSCERVRRTGEERWLRNCTIEELAPSDIVPQETSVDDAAATSNVMGD